MQNNATNLTYIQTHSKNMQTTKTKHSKTVKTHLTKQQHATTIQHNIQTFTQDSNIQKHKKRQQQLSNTNKTFKNMFSTIQQRSNRMKTRIQKHSNMFKRQNIQKTTFTNIQTSFKQHKTHSHTVHKTFKHMHINIKNIQTTNTFKRTLNTHSKHFQNIQKTFNTIQQTKSIQTHIQTTTPKHIQKETHSTFKDVQHMQQKINIQNTFKTTFKHIQTKP